jgi:nucleoside-diphosphate-sugar epimerase
MRGQDIVFLTPGAIYGPGVFTERALDPTSFNRAALRGLTGELESFVAFPMIWTYVTDVAEIALRALDHGVIGTRYLALGGLADVTSLAGFCNRAAELASVAHRVRDVDPFAEDAPDIGTMRQFVDKRRASPLFDATVTLAALDYRPTPLSEGLAKTIEWLRASGKIPA